MVTNDEHPFHNQHLAQRKHEKQLRFFYIGIFGITVREYVSEVEGMTVQEKSWKDMYYGLKGRVTQLEAELEANPSELEQLELQVGRLQAENNQLKRQIRKQDKQKKSTIIIPDADKKEWKNHAEDNGIKGSTFDNRVDLGWTYEEAATVPVSRHNISDDKKKWLDVAKSNGISNQTFNSRLRRGLTLEQAATQARKHYATKSYWHELALSKGMKDTTFRNRVRKGWTEQDAATIPVDKQYRKKKK